MAKVKVTWSPSAVNKLEEIFDFIAEDSPDRAAKFTAKLFSSTDRLAVNPHSGRICDEDSSCRQLTVETYRIIYEFNEDGIAVLTIISPGQDAVRILKPKI